MARHPRFQRLPDRCTHRPIVIQLLRIKLRIPAAKDQRIHLWHMCIYKRGKVHKLRSHIFQHAQILAVVERKCRIPGYTDAITGWEFAIVFLFCMPAERVCRFVLHVDCFLSHVSRLLYLQHLCLCRDLKNPINIDRLPGSFRNRFHPVSLLLHFVRLQQPKMSGWHCKCRIFRQISKHRYAAFRLNHLFEPAVKHR